MRAPSSELSIGIDGVMVTAVAMILDRIALDAGAGAADGLDRPEWPGIDAAARGDGVLLRHHVVDGRAGTTVPLLRRADRVQCLVMLRRSAAANISAASRCAPPASRARSMRAARLSCSNWSTSVISPTAPREGYPVASSSGWRWPGRCARSAVLFLDEPTASLDPTATKAVEDIIRTVGERNIKVVMATHDLGEARRLAGDIVMLHRGRIVDTGAAASFFDRPQTAEAKTFLAGELLV